MKHRVEKVAGKYYLLESPDNIIGPHNKFKLIWNTRGAKSHPFGYIPNIGLVIGDRTTTHASVGNYGYGRSDMHLHGRFWISKKIISFWEYPATLSELKRVINDINHFWNNVECFDSGQIAKKVVDEDDPFVTTMAKRYEPMKIDGDWWIDIPKTGEWRETYSDTVKRVKPGWVMGSYPYKIKTVFSGKPLKGVGEKIRKGEKINVDTGQEHVKGAMLKKNAIQKMSPEQKKQLYDYFKDKGKLDYQEKKMWDMLRKRYEDIEIYLQGNRIIIKENPDMVVAGYGDTSFVPAGGSVEDIGKDGGRSKRVAFWKDQDAIPFGMKYDKFWFGEQSRTHNDIPVGSNRQTGFDRRDFKYSGRLWWRKQIISFWEYPPFGELKKVLNQIAMDWAEQFGTHSINFNSWKIDIPRTSEIAKMDVVTGKDMLRGVSNWNRVKGGYDYQNTRLYSIKNVLSGKPLKGAGREWSNGASINTDKGQQHVAPAMVKQKAIQKMSDKQKQDLYNYFKNKGKLDYQEKKMWDMLRKRYENVNVFFDGKNIIIEEKKRFTLEEGTGILTVCKQTPRE